MIKGESIAVDGRLTEGGHKMSPRALTVKQPWAWAIVTGYKDVENRKRLTRLREPLLIHAGLRFSDAGFDFLDRHGIAYPPKCDLATGALVGTVELTDCINDSGSPWAELGYWHWVLTRPVEFRTPIRQKGSLGFFEPTLTTRRLHAAKAQAIHHRRRRLPKPRLLPP